MNLVFAQPDLRSEFESYGRYTACVTCGPQGSVDEISKTVATGAHAVVLMDQAGWHTTAALQLPGNLSLMFLPPKSPELNPVENIWQFMRQTWLANRVFDTYDAILDAGCNAWNKLIDLPETIISIGTRSWAQVGQ